MAYNWKWLFVTSILFTLSISSALGGGGGAPRKLLAPTFPYNVPNVNIPNLNFPPLPPTINLPFLPPTPLWPEYRLPPPITSLPDFPPVLTLPIASPPSITTTTP
ncbi:hypothetical protein C1H46_008632 [Malus baccata]|uniref:Uncharacterized protein n=1 Tax=Malus baccata TaxID=106549 RepID=A0A540N3T2_MALBA|nr:hypothetical protein C1H46_008632 [Malus baccata]